MVRDLVISYFGCFVAWGFMIGLYRRPDLCCCSDSVLFLQVGVCMFVVGLV